MPPIGDEIVRRDLAPRGPWRARLCVAAGLLLAVLSLRWVWVTANVGSAFRPPLVERGDAANWMGRIEELQVLAVDDPLGGYLFLSGFVGPDPSQPMPLQLRGGLRPEWLFLFDLRELRPVAVLRDAHAARADETNRLSSRPVGFVDGRVILDVTVTGPRADLKGQIARMTGLSSPGSTTWHSQLWQFEPERGELKPWSKSREIGRGWLSPLSPDGRHRVDGSPVGLMLYEPASGHRQPMPISFTGWAREIAWLPDSKSFFLADEMLIREINTDTGAVQWSRAQTAISAEFSGPGAASDSKEAATPVYYPSRVARSDDGVVVHVLSPPAEAPAGRSGLLAKPPGEQMAWQFLLSAGPWRKRQRLPREDALNQPQTGPYRVVMNPSWGDPASLPDDPNWELLLLELPSNTWRRLGPANRRTAYDVAGERRIEFLPTHGDRAKIRVTHLLTGNVTELDAEVPLPISLHVIQNPDRLFWTTKQVELWMLTIDDGAEPVCVWPKRGDEK